MWRTERQWRDGDPRDAHPSASPLDNFMVKSVTSLAPPPPKKTLFE